jgi:hypothetical protein
MRLSGGRRLFGLNFVNRCGRGHELAASLGCRAESVLAARKVLCRSTLTGRTLRTGSGGRDCGCRCGKRLGGLRDRVRYQEDGE